MKHRATPRFWDRYHQLPVEIQRLADRGYEVLRNDPRHPSLHLKKAGSFTSVRVGLHYRALAIQEGSDFVWVWIGPHADYDRLIQCGR